MQKKSILLVEDDAGVRITLRELIEQEYIVLEASNYTEAVNQLKNSVDLALVDYVLPDVDGFELINTIRKLKPSLPVIIMTGFSTESVMMKAVKTGVTDYIKKPLNLAHLKRRLSYLLEGKKEDVYSENVETREGFIIEGIVRYIDEHYMKGMSLTELSEKVCMNKFKLCKSFKEKTGCGIKSYLNSVRIKNASELLKSDNLNITEIACFVGFENIVSFYRAFRGIYGVSPKEYRENSKKATKDTGSLPWSSRSGNNN
ncbi:MAG: response regulator transcription factor [Nitrospirae bacterium]|nr:MAG: response regulator transcription factor [Nitrospirota bacterium]